VRILLAVVLVLQCARCAFAEPLTVKEIGLMLRCGYSSEAVLRSLSGRHFGGKIDPTTEKELGKAKAAPALIDALQSSNYAARD
jgi:hypothetical protein